MFNPKAFRFSNTGRPIVDDADLAAIEASYGPSSNAGGTKTNSKICDGTNAICRNTINCSGSTNDTCTNSTRSCETADGVLQ
jgi:hypothetical protein